jgi:hypothetical protein
MSDTVDFRDLLSSPMSDYPDRPDLPPRVTIFGKLVSVEAMASSNKGTPGFTFHIRPTDVGRDVPTDWPKKIAAAGFSLSDYDLTADFWLTPKSMVMLRRFLVSLGFGENVTFRDALKLADDGAPTAETQEAIRGLDVMGRTEDAADNGRVYSRLATVTGGKK